MQFCPHCGEEIKEPVTFCPRCGELLEQDVAERRTVTGHLKYGIEVLKQSPFLLMPQIILSLALMIGGLLFTKIYGADIFLEVQSAVLDGGDLTPYIPLFKLVAAYILVGTFFDMLIQPFIQHVYLTAVREEELDFGASFSYVLGRIGEFVVAQLIVLAIPAAIVLGVIGLLSNESIGNVYGFYLGFGLVSFVLIIMFFFMLSGIQIMVWEGTGFMDSFRLAVSFFKDRFGMLFSIGVLVLIVGMILQYMPLNQYYSFVPNIYFSIVEIDIFLNYRKMRG